MTKQPKTNKKRKGTGKGTFQKTQKKNTYKCNSPQLIMENNQVAQNNSTNLCGNEHFNITQSTFYIITYVNASWHHNTWHHNTWYLNGTKYFHHNKSYATKANLQVTKAHSTIPRSLYRACEKITRLHTNNEDLHNQKKWLFFLTQHHSILRVTGTSKHITTHSILQNNFPLPHTMQQNTVSYFDLWWLLNTAHVSFTTKAYQSKKYVQQQKTNEDYFWQYHGPHCAMMTLT